MSTACRWPSTHGSLLVHVRDAADERAWRTFVDLYSPMIVWYCCRRGLQSADAGDVTQEILLRVSRAIRSFEYDAERGRFRNWLGLIIQQQISRFRQRQQRLPQCPGGATACDVLSGEVDAVWIDTFNAHVYQFARQAIRLEFDAGTWRVFEQVWECGRAPADVAREMDAKPQWVYQAKFRVVQRLQAEIQRLSEDAPPLLRSD